MNEKKRWRRRISFCSQRKIIDLRKKKYLVKQGKTNPKGEAKFKTNNSK